MALIANKRSVMTLFSSPSDMYSHQVRIVLAEKAVSVEVELVNDNEENTLPPELVSLNPYKTVPTLVDRELALYDSKIIMEYLDERFPHPPLMPVYPVARGSTRLIIYRIERNWYSLFRKVLLNNSSKKSDDARNKLRTELLALAPIFSEYQYFMGEEFSLIDCYLAPLLWRLPQLGIELLGVGSNDIKVYMNRVFERDSFLASLTEVEREIRLI
ncbi:stringent starvation protein A [Candidatus Photodesmus katoptron]|uniref:Stringent starvation protein A n=1 Tax=Candidatus Photodesmus katoptron Akat1 TaxID=1236703 RepID=S3E0U9_9GAMM|nr:stringent starvation protein SspA [Candidatus Photodesmus katoptron]EPE37771.1 stringent starvation protein A [Candidatus Photodesmus katoptron Akat1]KEY90508.1 stringent starvation protein A [Candidatus Photodesmus katoptron]